MFIAHNVPYNTFYFCKKCQSSILSCAPTKTLFSNAGLYKKRGCNGNKLTVNKRYSVLLPVHGSVHLDSDQQTVLIQVVSQSSSSYIILPFRLATINIQW